MLIKVKNGIYYMQFPNLVEFPELVHGIFTRQNGHSPAPYHSLNLGLGLGDDDTLVYRNRCLLTKVLGNSALVFAHQVHGTHVLMAGADAGERSRQAASAPTAHQAPTGDALVTDACGQMLTIQVADCQAVLLYDPAKRVVANVHAGWRSSIGNIIGKTIARMQSAYGSKPSQILAGIGPSLGPCCAEFVNYGDEIPREFWHHKVGSQHFNFWAITCEQLGQAGVRSTHVHTSGICTRCNPEVFFSYRREKVTGRFAAVIGLQPPAPK